MIPEVDSLIGRELDGYLIEKLLGKGGMARVYRARDSRLERYVAFKVIEPGMRADPEYARRFEKEARAAAQLQHPNIVVIHRFGEVEGLYYMAMNYVEGVDLAWILSDYASDKKLMPYEDVLRVMSQVGSALDYAHSKGVIHRDIKPANVMLDPEGRAIVTDFGLALMQAEGTRGEVFGTPHYIAPEQAVSSAGAVPQSDQYSLGVILYEMLTGSLPYDGKSAMDIALAHMTEPLPSPLERNPDLNPVFVEILEKVLQKEPENRYLNCTALANDLERAVKSQTQQPTKPARVSMLHVSDQVKEFRAANPLPPLPARVAAGTPPPKPASTTRPMHTAVHQPASRQLWKWGAAVSVIVVIIGIAAIVLLLSSRGSTLSSPTPTAPVSVVLSTDMPLEVAASETFTSTPEPATSTLSLPTMTVAPVVLVPTQTPTTYLLNIIRRGGDSVFIVNPSINSFPLAELRIGDGDGAISGVEWGVAVLNNNECVTAWKDDGNPRAPEVSCSQVGTELTRHGRDRFWSESFNVYYNEILVMTCDKDETERGCLVPILVP